MPLDSLKTDLSEFVAFARTLRGDEKSESQTFLDHFFRALGHAGAIEAGATFEFRVAKKPGSAQLELIVGGNDAPKPKGGKKFADLLWPDSVLIEMKSRSANLEKHYQQALRLLDPHRPKAAALRYSLQLRRVLDLRPQPPALRSCRSLLANSASRSLMSPMCCIALLGGSVEP